MLDNYGVNDNYMAKLLIGTIIGLILVLLAVPLVVDFVANNQVANAAQDALDTLDSSYDSSLIDDSSKIVPTTRTAATSSEDTSVDDDSSSNNNVNLYKMHMWSGSITTGSSLDSKSSCSVYVGDGFAGTKIKISTLYSRDGNNLNEGRLVEKTVDNEGYVTLRAAEAYSLYPDYCYITIYDLDGNVLDDWGVELEPTSGTQYF